MKVVFFSLSSPLVLSGSNTLHCLCHIDHLILRVFLSLDPRVPGIFSAMSRFLTLYLIAFI